MCSDEEEMMPRLSWLAQSWTSGLANVPRWGGARRSYACSGTETTGLECASSLKFCASVVPTGPGKLLKSSFAFLPERA